jgi:hypothetical protein
MIGLEGAPNDDMNIRAAALELAVDAHDPDEVMVAAPGARVMPAAEEIVETAKVFEAYLRGTGEAAPEQDQPADTPAEDEVHSRVRFVRLQDLVIGGEKLDGHLARCSTCRVKWSASGRQVPPWMGGRSGG